MTTAAFRSRSMNSAAAEHVPGPANSGAAEHVPGLVPSSAVEHALRDAAARATLSPSIHNTQPWRFVVRSGRLDLYADPTRRLPAIDPDGRQLAISCGAALFGARVALAAARLDAVTSMLPDLAEPDLLALITVAGTAADSAESAQRLNAAANSRHSNRREFGTEPVPLTVREAIGHAADIEGASLQEIRDLDDRVAVAVLTQRAETIQNAEQAYRDELAAWTTEDPNRADGVPTTSIPSGTGPSHDDIPIRRFSAGTAGALPADSRSSLEQTMFVLCTAGDGLRDWLIAGQALGRALLELTSAGFKATILSQVAEVPSTREQLRQDLRLRGNPQLLLRVGVAKQTTATARRPLRDVIT